MCYHRALKIPRKNIEVEMKLPTIKRLLLASSHNTRHKILHINMQGKPDRKRKSRLLGLRNLRLLEKNMVYLVQTIVNNIYDNPNDYQPPLEEAT